MKKILSIFLLLSLLCISIYVGANDSKEVADENYAERMIARMNEVSANRLTTNILVSIDDSIEVMRHTGTIIIDLPSIDDVKMALIALNAHEDIIRAAPDILGFSGGSPQIHTQPTTAEISVYLDDTRVQFDVPPIIVENRTFVPFRAIFEALGMTVEWNNYTRTAIGANDDVVIEISIGSLIAIVNGEDIELDVAAMLYNGRTLVPLRFIAESTGAGVLWNEATRTVLITTN